MRSRVAPSEERSFCVRVPASTSNLGPGFDLLGLALSLYLEVEATLRTGGHHELADLAGEALCWPAERENLLLQAFERGCAVLGAPAPSLAVRARSSIPVGRGLGSSGAAVAAGLSLARAMVAPEDADAPSPVDPCSDPLLVAAVELEGHPDNAVASLLGGCTLALPHAGGLRVLRQPVHPTIGFAVAWPRSPLPTAEARRALPAQVPFGDAVENARRLAALLEGLRTGDPELLALGEEDRLHVPYRLPRIRGGARALDAARDAGAWLATVSGSGSGLVALGPHAAIPDVASAMERVLEAEDGPAAGRVVEPVYGAPRVGILPG